MLLDWARARLREELGGDEATRPDGDVVRRELGATFVTCAGPIGRLQGCIGIARARTARSLDDVAHNAVAAGTARSRARSRACSPMSTS